MIINGNMFEVVDDFVYVRSLLTAENKVSRGRAIRRRIAWRGQACSKLKKKLRLCSRRTCKLLRFSNNGGLGSSSRTMCGGEGLGTLWWIQYSKEGRRLEEYHVQELLQECCTTTLQKWCSARPAKMVGGPTIYSDICPKVFSAITPMDFKTGSCKFFVPDTVKNYLLQKFLWDHIR